ncbi:Exopolygalacturonase [Dichanthelium oligosanthes]|uniref:Exopolygalacturonase n=1 Tax=Dichanthelium oligosanthes TaxID=888268 RepID=A0A1E5W1N0_9POAL|nr:Exopolygalacturonase [Dichanthelium oligosanthes]
MASIFKGLIFYLAVVALLSGGHAHGKNQAARVYDVTKYGAAPSKGDNKDAFLAAWRAACHSTAGNSTLLFPKGTFAAGAVQFEGPCKNGNAPAVVIDGVLQPCSGRGGGGGCQLSDDAWLTFSDLNNLLVTGAGTLDGQGHHQSGKAKAKPTTLVFEDVTNATLRGLGLVNSRGFHVNFRRCTRVVAEGLGIHAPAASRNTDGVHVGFSSHVRILNSVIGTGDDCVSVGPGCTDVVVSGVICGPGHGLSVGSLGKDDDGEQDVRGVVIKNCTVNGTTNGVRIKTWPGSPPSRASNITFQDITMDNVSNPIIIDQRYCPHDHCADADKPSLVQISDVTYRRIEGTSNSSLAVRLLCSEKRPCTGVRLDGINLTCGGVPCRSEFSNVRGSVAQVLSSPGPAVQREEAADDVASSGTEQLGRFTWWLPFTVRGRRV